MFFLCPSWSFGPCLSLHHLDLSGCEKITDLTLKKLSVGLGDLTPPTCSDKRSDRRAKLLKSSTVPITLMDERNLRHPVVRKRQAFIFKQGSGRWGSTCTPTHVWVLDSSDLTDIEDAAWSRQGSRSSLSRAENLVETQLMDCCCVCRRNSRRHWSSTSYLQHQVTAAAGSAEIFCGHSTCCSADVAFRTLIRPQCSSGSGGNSVPQFWTKCSSSVGLQCPEPEKKTDQSRARRSLRFLSLSGCYQVTDLGLR